MRLGEWREKAEWEEEVGDAAAVVCRQVVFDDVAIGCAKPGQGSGNQAGVVRYRRTGVRNLHGTSIGDGFKESEEGDLMRRKTWMCWRTASDLGDVNGLSVEGGKDESLREGPMSCEPQVFRGGGHLAVVSWRCRCSKRKKLRPSRTVPEEFRIYLFSAGMAASGAISGRWY